MEQDHDEIIKLLMEKGQSFLDGPRSLVGPDHKKYPEANKLIDNLDEYPHAFVLACIMDKQVKAEKAWLVPYKISQEIGGFEFEQLLKINSDKFKDWFINNNYLRFNKKMSLEFHSAIQHIHNKYGDDASLIWANKPTSSRVVRNFLGFEGVGIKIATMAANILVREYKIKFRDLHCIGVTQLIWHI